MVKTEEKVPSNINTLLYDESIKKHTNFELKIDFKLIYKEATDEQIQK